MKDAERIAIIPRYPDHVRIVVTSCPNCGRRLMKGMTKCPGCRVLIHKSD